jgi:hypothetical protein
MKLLHLIVTTIITILLVCAAISTARNDRGKAVIRKDIRKDSPVKKLEEKERAEKAKEEEVKEKVHDANEPVEGKEKIKGHKESGEEKAGGRGKEHQQQLEALDKQLGHEAEKHNRRVARLNRIRELAEKEGKDEIVSRVDRLMDKERSLYDRKRESMLERKKRIEGGGEAEESKVKKEKDDESDEEEEREEKEVQRGKKLFTRGTNENET